MRARRFALVAIVVSLLGFTSFSSPDTSGFSAHPLLARLDAQAGPQISRGPYLQMGTPTSVVVRWRTTTATDSVVDYGPDPANLIFSARVSTPATNHEVELTLLQPATKYYYSVGTTTQRLAGGDGTHFFVTSPPIGSATPTRIWVLGDSGTADLNAETVRDAYYAFTGSTITNLWLMLGDNAYNDGLDTEYQRAVFEMYPATLGQSVLWPTKGNHDTSTAPNVAPYYDIFTLPRNGQAGGVASGTEAYYSFDYGNIHFICLNSFDVDLSVGSPMLTWLQNDLASTTARWIIAYWHHPPYSKGSHDSDIDFELTEMRQNALPILEAGGADLVLTGHSHSYERSFLIDGHYGRSNTFSGSMAVDAGSGRESGTGAYRKFSTSPAPHAGTVYAVAGSSGNIGGGTLNHPAMFVSLNVMGSLVLDVNDGRLDVQFVDDHSAVRDSFTILKDPVAPLVVTSTNLPNGGTGTPYLQSLAATGGRQPYAWSTLAGSLPAGLALNPATGVISGTPTASGTSVFTVRVTDGAVPAVTADRGLSIAIAAEATVPDLVEMTQAGATAAIIGAGLTQGTIGSASSASVPIGRVISQSPAAGTQVVAGSLVALVISSGNARPVVIGSQIAGTFADASGHSGQSHLFYASNARVWWLLTLSSSADSQGGTNHLIKAYRSTGPDLASATWTAAASSPGAAVAGSTNCGSCSMGGGRSLGVAYLNNVPTDAVHAEVAMASNGQNGLTAHIRATVTATAINWETWSYYDAPAATWTMPRGNALGISTGRKIHSGGPILQQEVDANVRVSTNADTGAAWTSGFSAVSLIDNSMFHQSNSMTFAALASNRMLSVYDNGGGQAPCYQCTGGVPEPGLSNLGYRRSNVDGSWPTLVPGGQATGDGKVFSTDATIDHNDWTLVSRDTASIYAFRRNAAGTGVDAATYNAATNTWGVFASPPPFGSGQSHKPGSGVFGAATGSGISLFVISNDSSNSILYTKYEAAVWSAWATVPGTDSGPHVRNFISGHPIAAAGQIGVVWTEGTTQFDVVTTSVPLASTVPDVLGLTQAVAAARITGADLSVGTVTLASSASVAAGWVISQSPAAGSSLPPGSAVDLVIALAKIPNVVNLTQAAAVAAITNAGLTVGTVGAASSGTVPIGSVVSQSPAALLEVAAGTRIDVVVSTGIAVPDVLGRTQSAAQALISSVAGLAIGTITSAVSDSVPSGSVISQNPAAGTNVSSGTAIDLVVSSGPPTVPNVVGLTQAVATASITSAGLAVGTVSSEASATVAVGLVISESPVAGSPVVFGSAVSLVISLGAAPVPAPDVVNATQAAATGMITGAGLTVGAVTQAASATVPAGSVISQVPTAGTMVPANGAVNLVVSTGRPPVATPNVISQTLAAATASLQSAGLAVGTTTNASSTTVPSGSVISQSPAAGTQVAFGSAVNLVVSTGPPPVVVPNVVALTQSAASSAMTVAGLAVGTINSASSATVPAGSVISQNPAPGTQVAFGSAVNLVVSTGPPPVSVPSVVNLPQAQAATAITGAGLVVGAITTVSSATVPAGTVISQSPAAATLATPGSAVSIVVSSGPAAPSPIVDKVVFSDGSSTRTTPSFSTAVANELLLAFVGSDGPASAGSQAATVTGAGLTWTLVRRSNAQAGTSEVWQAKAAAKLTNVTVKSTQSLTGYRQSLTVVAFRGASGIGASAAANAASGAPSVTLVTTKANVLVYGVGSDWDRAVARTLGTGQVMVHQSVVSAVGDTFWVQSRNAAVPAAGTSVQVNCTAPTNDRWNLVGVEVVP